MTSYFTAYFIAVVIPVTALAYSLVPHRLRWAVLLAASYVFALFISKALIAFMALSSISVYAAGLGIGRIYAQRDNALEEAASGKKEIKQRFKKRARIVLFALVILNFGILIALKYLGFFSELAGGFLSAIGVDPGAIGPRIHIPIGVPIGISFYTLMAVSYLVDVYRESIAPDRHLGRIALFLSFFPLILEGPICRYTQTAHALTAGQNITRSGAYKGALRIAIGFAKKLIIADRLNVFVEPVFENYTAYDGGVIAMAAILYTIQLYCDFAGTMDVALGTAQIFNVTLPENFRQPFFSRSASEFWQRWHITLGTWFKDYVYYPITLSKPVKSLTAKARKRFGNRYGPLLTSSIALFCVWLGNGLWHGAGSQYVFFGMYYFVMILAGGFIEPLAQKLASRFGIDRKSAGYRAFQITRTVLVIFTGELFFRATSFSAGIEMFGAIFTRFSLDGLAGGALLVDILTVNDYVLIAIFAAIVLVLDILNERGFNVVDKTCEQKTTIRWAVLIAVVLAVVLFGAYGYGYTPVDPMYASF